MPAIIAKLKSQPIQYLIGGGILLVILLMSAMYRLGLLVGEVIANMANNLS